MHRAVADLFVGDREALTRSAVEAGYAKKYGLDPAEAALPQQFALVGHSLGGGLVSGVAGYTVDNGAAANLVGVILLDGVPTGDVLPNALAKLDAYEQSDGGRYIPVRVIGAPTNFFNSSSNANQALSEARPDRYNGVVLVDGVHMDAMQGGNPSSSWWRIWSPAFRRRRALRPFRTWPARGSTTGSKAGPMSATTLSRVRRSTSPPKGTARATVIGEPPATSLAGYWPDLVA